MDNTLKQLLQELVAVSMERDKIAEQLRLLQADYTDLKNKTEKSLGAGKSV